MKRKRRRLASVQTAIVKLGLTAAETKVLDSIVGKAAPLDAVAAARFMWGPAPATFEVYRFHEGSGRVQLHAWGHASEQEARADVDSMHAEMERQGGLTDALGLLEYGWVYRHRKAYGL